jgi:anti-sigma-K factor RskA
MPAMNDRVREQLLGYLLGALDVAEQEAVEQQLKHDRVLRRQLGELHKALRPLRAGRIEFAPPPGLAERTCEEIFSPAASSPPASLSHEALPAKAAARPLPTPRVGRAHETATAIVGRSGGWSWLDLAVAASILVAGLLLIFPALENSRFQAQITACQENLRQVGVALVQYSQHHNGYFPPVPAQGHLAAAGVYAPTLFDSGYLTEPQLVVCPGAPAADKKRITIPTLQQLQTLEPKEKLVQVQSTMGGNYGYSLGHMVQGRYEPTRNQSRPNFALMADAPDYSQPDFQSINHGGRGQNVLFEDGRIAFLPTAKPNAQADNVFLNDTGRVAAGTHENDSVVSASGATPFQVLMPVSTGNP